MIAPTLNRLGESSRLYRKVMRGDLHPGDWVLVRTLSSEYRLHVLKNGMVEASGGWFDKQGYSPMIVGVSGATWGGSCYMPGVFVAVGLRLEFRIRLITSPVQEIILITRPAVN